MAPSSPARSKVLIADDYPSIATAMTRLLSMDYDVVGTVADGRDVLDAVRRLAPDVVVLDLNMPYLNGLDACRQITEAAPGVKVIVVTAMTDEAIMREAYAAGAAGFLPKYAVEDLLVVMKKIRLEPGPGASAPGSSRA